MKIIKWGIRKKILTFLIVVISFRGISQELNLKKLENMKNTGKISLEDYEILKNEILGDEVPKNIPFSILINEKIKMNDYRVILKDQKYYFPIFSFFQILQFNNYNLIKEVLTIQLGKNLEKVVINLRKNELSLKGSKEKLKMDEKDYIFENGEIYLESSIFQKIFLNTLKIDKKKMMIWETLSFNPPFEIEHYLNRNMEKILEKSTVNELMYTNKKSIFDLGYLEVDFTKEFSKGAGERKYNSNWNGKLDYQGTLLYGEFFTNYNVKEKLIGTAEIYYPELYNNHSLKVGSYGDLTRELALSFRKEKGYFIENNEIIIKENVPIGSKVELLYMGFPLDIKTEEDGEVEFRNKEIKRDRKYILRVYTNEGKIYDIEVDTKQDFRQQGKGQIEYDFDLRENHSAPGHTMQGNILYGFTEKLTLGIGGRKELIFQDENKEYINYFKGEGVYSDTIFKLPYTLAMQKESAKEGRTITNYEGKIDIFDFSMFTQQKNYGKYYKPRKNRQYSIDYNPGYGFSTEYNYYIYDYHKEEQEVDYDFGVSFYKSPFKDLFVSTDVRKSRTSKHSYSLYLNYTGFDHINTRLDTDFYDDGKEYMTTLAITNKNLWDILDFSIEFNYSSESQSKVSLRFNLDYENFLKFGFSKQRGGSTNYSAGLHKIVDLKNVGAKVESINSTRAEIITFIDENKNNILDEGETPVDNVEVKIGDKKVVTDKEGKGWIYGIPNGILYELDPKIRKPSYTIGNNKIMVRGKKVGTVQVYIPVIPMMNLSGVIDIEESLGLSKEKKQELYEKIVVKIIDKSGKTMDITLPNENGYFDISGLYPEGYTVDISYHGDEEEDYAGINLKENIKIGYSETGIQKIRFNLKKNRLVMIKNEGEI